MEVIFEPVFDAAPLLYGIVLIGAPLLLLAVLVMWPRAARASKFSPAQRGVAELAVAAAVIPGIMLLTSPSSYGGPPTLLREMGPGIFVLLLIPVISALPSVVGRPTMRTLYAACGALLLVVFCFVGAFSIGPLYTPATVLLLIAGVIGLIPARDSDVGVADVDHGLVRHL